MSSARSPHASSGPQLFARYAFPPNHHGYCGPEDAADFFSNAVAGDDLGLRRMAKDFDGALPFLQLIAESNQIEDLLDPRVVEAYWLGGPALGRVSEARVSDAAEAGSRLRPGPLFASLRAAVAAGALPHHSFTVFCVYPWISMLGDERRTPQAMIVLDRCRIRWGTVLDFDGDQVVAESQPLVWEGRQLALGSPVIERVRRTIDGISLSGPLAPGDLVTLHWDWVCDRITTAQRDALQAYSGRHLDIVNRLLAAAPVPAESGRG